MNISKNIINKSIVFLWSSMIIGLSLISLWIYLVSINANNWFGGMPSIDDLENPKKQEASVIYSADNIELGKYYIENRSPVRFEEISPNLINSLKATEDFRFEDHSGIDIIGLFRVAFKTILLRQSNSGGGSTISQQLAKNLFNTRSQAYKGTIKNRKLNLVVAKTKEWITAIRLERSYTKKEIISMYLNTVDFGSNSFGIKTASATFFNSTPDSLQLHEAALLVGLLKAPTYYSPILNPDHSITRRNTVFSQLKKYNYITKSQEDSLGKLTIGLKYSIENHNTGLATYFRSVITDYLRKWCKERGLDLYTDGLKIYTTIDSRMQKHAEMAVEKHMKENQKLFFKQWSNMTPWRDEKLKEIPNFISNTIKRTDRYRELAKAFNKDSVKIWEVLQKPIPMKIFSYQGEIDTVLSPIDSFKYYKHFLHAGLLSVDSETGQVKAWVGGINHKYFKYDHVKQGIRQPGSTFKPFVYATAIDNGYSPCMEVMDAPVAFETQDTIGFWSPQNSDGKFTYQPFTLRKAMANSINSITAKLVQEVSPNQVVNMARRLGITTPLDPVPAICLGVFDVNIYEMVGAYNTFTNKGTWIEPLFITKIEDKNGNIIQQFIPDSREAISERTADMMVHMLKGATQEKGGTALGLYRFNVVGYGNEVAAKTGTTQNYSDGWFIGLVPKLTTGIWVGGEDRAIHLRGFNYAQGARTAMPIWAYYMQNLFEDKELNFKRATFPYSKVVKPEEINCTKYKESLKPKDNPDVLIKTKQDLPDFGF